MEGLEGLKLWIIARVSVETEDQTPNIGARDRPGAGLCFCSTPLMHHSIPENKQSLPNLAVKQGLNGGWEFAVLSFPG